MDEILNQIRDIYGKLKNLLADCRVQESKLALELEKVAADRKILDDRFIEVRNREDAVMVREGKVDALDKLEALRLDTHEKMEVLTKNVSAFENEKLKIRQIFEEREAVLVQRETALSQESARLAAKEKTMEADIRKKVLSALGVKEGVAGAST